ncbi:MAG: hypothetical protein ACJ8MH_14070, partial [Povalibacter sp.]
MSKPKKLVTALGLFVLCVSAVFAQATRDPLFASLSTAIDQARQSQVDALAPASFRSAFDALQSATRDAEKGRNPDRVKTTLNSGMAAIQKANAAAASARETLRSVVTTRSDAINAAAPKLAAEQWLKADERFREATAALERNDVKNAQQRAAEADVLLRDVELVAIRNRVLNESRGLIAQADAAKVERFAPRTLNAAKKFLAQAEQEINRNRYEPATAEGLAAQASYEARHSMYLARTIESTLDKKGDEAGLEELILSWEEPLRQIASSIELQARFDNGPQTFMQQLQTKTQEQSRDLQHLRAELQDRNDQIAALNAEMQKLEARLGGVSQERIALQRRVDAQERLRSNVAQIESSFTQNEARVFRQGDDVVISLLGIRFASGRSTLDAANTPLMNKVRDALA